MPASKKRASPVKKNAKVYSKNIQKKVSQLFVDAVSSKGKKAISQKDIEDFFSNRNIDLNEHIADFPVMTRSGSVYKVPPTKEGDLQNESGDEGEFSRGRQTPEVNEDERSIKSSHTPKSSKRSQTPKSAKMSQRPVDEVITLSPSPARSYEDVGGNSPPRSSTPKAGSKRKADVVAASAGEYESSPGSQEQRYNFRPRGKKKSRND